MNVVIIYNVSWQGWSYKNHFVYISYFVDILVYVWTLVDKN